MTAKPNRYPLYIPSKGRWDNQLTMKALDSMGLAYYVVVEEQEYDKYVDAGIDKAYLLVLDKAYQRAYDTFDDLGDTKPKGSGPARNFIWDHSISLGHAWHWVMDDNIRAFYRMYKNKRYYCYAPAIFTAMEDWVLRFRNIALAGPNYVMFAPDRQKTPPFVLNTRIYSCIFIRNDLPFRWRGRHNEDTDLSLKALKGGWCTVQFNAFLQQKIHTMQMKGGNTDAFYAQEGRIGVTKLLMKMHPDVVRMVWRFKRVHHYIDYRPFQRDNKLVLRDGVSLQAGNNEYGMALQAIDRAERMHPKA